MLTAMNSVIVFLRLTFCDAYFVKGFTSTEVLFLRFRRLRQSLTLDPPISPIRTTTSSLLTSSFEGPSSLFTSCLKATVFLEVSTGGVRTVLLIGLGVLDLAK